MSRRIWNQGFLTKGLRGGKNSATLNTLVYPKKSGKKISQNLPRKEQQKRLETTRSSTAVACFAPFEKRSVIIWDSIIIWEWAFEGILRPICREKGHSCGMAGWRIAANLAKFQLGPSHSFSLEQNLSFLLCFRCNLENHSFWNGLEEIYAKWDFNGNENTPPVSGIWLRITFFV